MIEGHGDDAWKYTTALKADFSSNVRYGDLDPGLLSQLRDSIPAITHYPEAGASTLQTAAATVYGISPDDILVTNGATEAIYLIAQTFRHKKATILTPAFAEYEDACRLHGLDIQRQPWESLPLRPSETRPLRHSEARPLRPSETSPLRLPEGLVFLCNPNNPTGIALPLARLQQLIYDHPDTLFIIDESYIEFTLATESLLPSLHDYQNVLILRSLTKSCRIPGLRLGFVMGHSDLVRRLYAAKMPWSVNRLAIEAGIYILRHRPSFALPLRQLLDATAAWRQELKTATGWRIHDTDTHYFLVEIGDSSRAATPDLPSDTQRPGARPISATALKQHLVERHGLLIRDASNFYGLTPFHFRVACQSPDHNQLLTDALRQCSRTGI